MCVCVWLLLWAETFAFNFFFFLAQAALWPSHERVLAYVLKHLITSTRNTLSWEPMLGEYCLGQFSHTLCFLTWSQEHLENTCSNFSVWGPLDCNFSIWCISKEGKKIKWCTFGFDTNSTGLKSCTVKLGRILFLKAGLNVWTYSTDLVSLMSQDTVSFCISLLNYCVSWNVLLLILLPCQKVNIVQWRSGTSQKS